MSVNVYMTGIKEMQANLRRLGTKKALRAPAAAVRAGSKVIINQSRSAAPVDTGTLKKALGQKVKTYRSSKVVVSVFGVRNKLVVTAKGNRNPVKYAHLVEFGTRNGVKANPFMRRSFKTSQDSAAKAVITKMKQIFDSESKSIGI
tara:strand:- start:720 stop:1157 length:438 start_codon:yes stop_codon:yes gene_type:complete